MSKPRLILDTNILISYNLKPSQVIVQAVRKAFDYCTVLVSQDTYDELRSVIERFVKRKYITIEEASEFLGSYVEATEWVKVLEEIQVCRDPKDDKFLELAINGKAEYLITGDQDLLVLHPFRNTKILSTKEFIDLLLT